MASSNTAGTQHSQISTCVQLEHFTLDDMVPMSMLTLMLTLMLILM